VKRIIINRPELQSPLQRVTTRGITFVFWVVWIYLWLPLISLAAWLVGIHLFRAHMLDNDGYKALFSDVHQYAIVIVIIAAVLIGWARYNLLRFRDKGNRKASRHVDLDAQAQFFKTEPQQLRRWREAKRLVIHHDKQGNITQVETGTPTPATHVDASVGATPGDQSEPTPE
jgi:biofilm PGA synthesis protein PgaD